MARAIQMMTKDASFHLSIGSPKTMPVRNTSEGEMYCMRPLRQLLTHTAGFEETLKNLFVAHESDMKSLRTYLVNQMPARIFPPGKVPSYSNYGFTLAGYIVERVSGEKFERYIDESHFAAAADDQFDVRSTTAAATRASNVESLSQRLEEAARFRIRPSRARRGAFNHRRRYDTLHARLSSGWQR